MDVQQKEGYLKSSTINFVLETPIPLESYRSIKYQNNINNRKIEMFFISSLLQGATIDLDWKSYAIGSTSTILIMPITYNTANMLTHTSNRLLVGLLPPILTSILVPSTTASISTHYGKQWIHHTDENFEIKNWGKTVGIQTLWFTTAAIGKMDINQRGNRLLYTSVNALLLPLPTLLSSNQKQSQGKWHFGVTPQYNGTMISGGYYGTF